MSKASLGQGKQVLDLLSGYTAEEIQQLIQAGDLLKLLAGADLRRVDRAALAKLLRPATSAHAGFFSSPQGILKNFEAASRQQRWGFTEEELNELSSSCPLGFESKPDQVLTLDIWLGNLEKTFDELWDCITQVRHLPRTNKLRSGEEDLRLLNPDRYGWRRSARWVVLDPTTNHGEAPLDVRTPESSPGLEILTATAFHPMWMQTLPWEADLGSRGVWLPGLEIKARPTHQNAWDAWDYAPVLSYLDTRSRFDLREANASSRYGAYSVPVRRGEL